MDARLKKINAILAEYALGNFEKKIRPSSKFDEIDSFIVCINMLGEELKESTISKNYFNNIFNSVSDMIFVLDLKGKILITSESANEKFHLTSATFNNKYLSSIEAIQGKPLLQLLTKNLKTKKQTIRFETVFKINAKKKMPVACSAILLYNEKKIKTGFLLNARDLTNIKKYEHSLKESEQKYQKLFEASSDSIFISDKDGNLLDINHAGRLLFKSIKSSKDNINLFSLFNKTAVKRDFLQQIKALNNIVNYNTQVICHDKSIIDCLISASIIKDEKNKIIGYRGIIKDITKQKETENLVYKTIVNTQEAERKRFAKDIHDSIGQQLSAIKFYIGAAVSTTENKNQKDILTKANDGLISALAEIRNVCFDLMPKTLENFGLAVSLKELCKQTEVKGKLSFKINVSDSFPLLNKQLEISVFRVVQEFINNSLKHSNANTINIDLLNNKNEIKINLKDNGVGFNLTTLDLKKGMGLRNVQSRLSSYNGVVTLNSSLGKGTQYKITIPLTKTNVYNAN